MSGSVKKEQGSYTIEAALSLFIFMIAFLSIVSYIKIIQTETQVQHAINQAAYEISNYCYLADRAFDIGREEETSTSEAINAVTSFISEFSSGSSGSEDDTSDLLIEKIGNVNETYSSISRLSESIKDMLEENDNDVSKTLSVIVQTMAGDIVRDVAGRVAGIALANMLVPDYLPEESKLYGIEGGSDGINYGLSTVLSDGRTVRIVAIYKIKLLGFGIFDVSYTVSQSAVTHAWLYEKDDLSEEITVDIWKTDAKERGKEFVSMYKEASPYKAVKAGVGVDLYDRAAQKMTSVVSVNIFSKSYSEYATPENGEEADFSNYTVNQKALKSELKQRAKKLSGYVSKLENKKVNMESGVTYSCGGDIESILKVIFPKEANNESWHEIFENIAAEIEKETGVKVEYEYRYYALQ